MKACVTFNSSHTDEIAMDNEVKQADILIPTLFSIYFVVLLKDCEAGLYSTISEEDWQLIINLTSLLLVMLLAI